MPPKGPPAAFLKEPNQGKTSKKGPVLKRTFLVQVKRALDLWEDLQKLTANSQLLFLDKAFDMLQSYFNQLLSHGENMLKKQDQWWSNAVSSTTLTRALEEYPTLDCSYEISLYRQRLGFLEFLDSFETHLLKFEDYWVKFDKHLDNFNLEESSHNYSFKGYRVSLDKYQRLLHIYKKFFNYLEQIVKTNIPLLEIDSPKSIVNCRQKSTEILAFLLYSPDVHTLKYLIKNVAIILAYEKDIFTSSYL